MVTIATIFGTRPEAVKMAPVIAELAKRPDEVRSVVIVSGQHREMLDQVLRVFGITPTHDLDVMLPRQTLSGVAARVLERLEPVMERERPDAVFVQGDTTTTFVGALSGYYHRALVGHVEAGLRTSDKYNPFPEEINRRLTTTLADLHFAPTPQSADALLREGVAPARVHVVGNTVIDALLEVAERPYTFADSRLEALGSDGRKVVLVTAHRRENFGQPMRNIGAALRRLSEREDTAVVVQLHKNPEARDALTAALAGTSALLIEPQEYVPWVHLMRRATLILTDSGGIQEEAPALGKPALVMRETTERPEGVQAGVARLVGTDPERLFAEASRLLEDSAAYNAMARATNPYGDGHAARRIVDLTLSALKERSAA